MKTDASLRLDDYLNNPNRAIWSVSLPMIVGFSTHAIYQVIDSVFIGKLGFHALAASGYIHSLFFVSIALTNGLASGITASASVAFGKRDQSEINSIASNGLMISILISLVFSVVGLLSGKHLIVLLGANGPSVELAWEYMVPIWMGMPLFFISASIRSVINAEGDSKTPMVVLLISTFLNLILDPLFMFVLGWGIKGAAYATICAQFFAFGAFVYIAFIKKKILSRFSLRNMKPHGASILKIFNIGFPVTTGFFIMSLGAIFINKIISSFGQAAVAGYVAASRIDMCVSLPIMAVASSAMILTGMFKGAKRKDLVKITIINSYKWALFFAVALGSLVYFFSEQVIALFVDNQESTSIGVEYLGYAVFIYPMMAVGMTTGRILQGLGYGWPSLLLTTVRVLGLSVPLACFFVYVLNMEIFSVWLSILLSSMASVILSVVFIFKFSFK